MKDELLRIKERNRLDGGLDREDADALIHRIEVLHKCLLDSDGEIPPEHRRYHKDGSWCAEWSCCRRAHNLRLRGRLGEGC